FPSSNVFASSFVAGPGPYFRCSRRSAGSNTIDCSVCAPWLTKPSRANTSATPSFASSSWSGSKASYRQHRSPSDSPSQRKWLVQQQTSWTADRTSTVLGVISNTAPPSLSQMVRQAAVVRRAPRTSFSASDTVRHSSSTRRNNRSVGVPSQSNAAWSFDCLRWISLIVQDSPASFIPEMQPTIGVTVTIANDRFPSGWKTASSVCSVIPFDGSQSKFRPNKGAPVLLRPFSTTTVEQPIPLERS